MVPDPERIESWLLASGLTAPSLAELRPQYPRWIARLREWGVDPIPAALTDDGSNLLLLLVRQAMPERNPSLEHDLRNLTGVRPYKL
jgi:hypothetical protein